MHKLILTTYAAQRVQEILTSVYEFTGFASTPQKLLAEFEKTFDLIAYMPTAAGRIIQGNRREAFCRGYRIVYDIVGDEVHIQTVIHSRRLYPRP